MGRPFKTINWDEFDKLISYQCTKVEICSWFNIDDKTLDAMCLRERGETYSEIQEKKKNFGRVKLKKIQFEIAESNHPASATMAIYLGKYLLGQTDQPIDKEVLEIAQRHGITRNEAIEILENAALQRQNSNRQIIDFKEFCIKAGYPEPFEKQVDMMKFGFEQDKARLLLGARGYGKTDYVVILGTAYEIYKNPTESTNLIMSKSKERNAAMLAEIAQACKLNGMVFEKENSTSLRAKGLHGKDHSVSAVTIKTVTLRGRHPKRIILDDPVTEDDTSDATRSLVEKKYNEVLKLTDNVLIIGQPAHKYDLYAKLRPLLNKLELPHGSIPELDHDIEAQRLAGVDESSIQASYFLNILNEGSTPFDDIKYLDQYPSGSGSVAFIDPSHEGGDYTAITILKAYMSGVAVVGHVYKKAWNHCLDDIAPLLKKYNVQKLAFETNALGDMPIDMLRKAFNGIGIVGRRTVTNKHSRIMAAGAYSHLIHLSKESSRTYIDHVVQYEYKAKYDDAPDSLATCLEWIGLVKGRK